MEKYKVRPGYKSKELLVEFWGDHRGSHFPDIQGILADGLNAKPYKHLGLDTVEVAIATDEIIPLWTYENGEYQLDDDIWAFFIHARRNNAQVIADIDRVLSSSGKFVKEVADFTEYE